MTTLLHSGGAKVTLLFPPQPLRFQNAIWGCPSRTPGPTRWDQLWHLHMFWPPPKLLPYRLLAPQMANLAHRASQFMDKKFLIIHPTADGATLFFASSETNRNNNNKGRGRWHVVSLCRPRESSFPAHSQVYQPAHQRKGQLHLTGGWTVPPSFSCNYK